MPGSTTLNRNGNIREYQNQNDCEGLSQSKGIPGSITIKMTAREYKKIVKEYYNTNDCKGAFELAKLPGNIKIKRIVETNTTREYHNQKDFIGVVLPGSVKTRGLPESTSITDISKVLSENITINVLHASITIQSTARNFHKQKYFQ